jgi:hypothetical protein
LSKLPYNNLFANSLACGFWLPPANNLSAKRKTGLHSDTMWYDREYVTCHIAEISVISVRFFLLLPPVSDIWQPKCTTNLHCIGVVIMKIRNVLPPVLWDIRRLIQLEPCDCQ